MEIFRLIVQKNSFKIYHTKTKRAQKHPLFLFVLACDKLPRVGQLFYLGAELPPLGKAVVFPLAVDGFQAAVIGGETGVKLKAAGGGLQQAEIVLGILGLVVAVFQLLHYLYHAGVYVFYVLL